VFTEDYVSGGHFPLLSTTGLATTGKPPAIIWTYSWDEVATSVGGGADAYMQSHLYMKLFPMAPVFGADHSIDNVTAGGAGRAAYLDYAHLFDAVRGGCWHLAADPVRVEATAPAPTGPPPSPAAPAALAAAFTVGGGCTDPATAGGNGPVAALVLFVWLPGPIVGAPVLPGNATVAVSFVAPPGLPGTAGALACEATAPGRGGWAALPPPTSGGDGRWRFPGGAGSVALDRGCAMVRCTAAGGGGAAG
jgi:hypothetical protein